MSSPTTLLPFQPMSMSSAQLAAVSFLARYSGRTHDLYAFQLRRWFSWCESNGLDPLIGIQRAHVELYIRQLGESGLMDSSVVTMMHGACGVRATAEGSSRRVPHPRSGSARADPFLQIAQTLTVYHGALAFLLGINALRASEVAAVRIEDYAETLRGHRVLHLVGKRNKPATMPLTVPVLRVLEACRGERIGGSLIADLFVVDPRRRKRGRQLGRRGVRVGVDLTDLPRDPLVGDDVQSRSGDGVTGSTVDDEATAAHGLTNCRVAKPPLESGLGGSGQYPARITVALRGNRTCSAPGGASA